MFPDDIRGFPPERKVGFTINLVPDTSHMSMAPYKMCASELSELKE